MENDIKYRSKRQFFLTNLVRGFAILAVLVLAFIFFKRNLDVESIAWLEPLYSRPGLMFFIYTLSEVLFGIIPPELFMIWATSYESLETYVSILFGLMLISYGAGWFAFWVGKRFRYSAWYRLLKRRYLRKYELYLQEYGSFLIVVAAITPLPFAGVCMLVGSVDYPVRKFLVYSLFRLLRYVVYASIIWEASFF